MAMLDAYHKSIMASLGWRLIQRILCQIQKWCSPQSSINRSLL
jgi:hypothetical protein